jgi:hypothetical protein
MEVLYEDQTYIFDFDEITVQQAKVIKVHCGMTLKGLEDGLADGDADALRALYWLMMVTNGEKANIDTIDFKIVRFSKAIQDAAAKERIAADEAEAKEAAATAAAGRRPKAKTITKP